MPKQKKGRKRREIGPNCQENMESRGLPRIDFVWRLLSNATKTYVNLLSFKNCNT
jgi:hypothetical protein